jgi:hypothetical protein
MLAVIRASSGENHRTSPTFGYPTAAILVGPLKLPKQAALERRKRTSYLRRAMLRDLIGLLVSASVAA